MDTISISDKVYKTSNKPFKSGEKINTVKGFMTHPITGNEALTFLEDDSFVEARMCKKVKSD